MLCVVCVSVCAWCCCPVGKVCVPCGMCVCASLHVWFEFVRVSLTRVMCCCLVVCVGVREGVCLRRVWLCFSVCVCGLCASGVLVVGVCVSCGCPVCVCPVCVCVSVCRVWLL